MPWVYGSHYSGHWEGNRFSRHWIQNPLPDLEWRDETINNSLPPPNQVPQSQSDSVITSLPTAGQRVPIIYGKVRTGGIVIWEKSNGSGGWVSVYLLGWGPIKSITNIKMGTEPLATFAPLATHIYLGNSTTNATFDPIVNFLDANWISRLPGLAYIVIYFNNPNLVPDGKQPDPHSFICDVEGLYVTDHRLDSTLTNLYYTENVALAKSDHWINKRYGGGIPTDTIDFSTVDQAATDCDFVLANGSPRFKIGIKLGPDVKTWTENDILLGLHGQIWCSVSQGLRQMFVDGDQTASSINITDVGVSRNIINASFRLLEPEEVFNHFEFSYTDQANEFKPGSAITEDHGIALGTIYQVLSAIYDTHGSPSFDQSKRLSIWAFNNSRLDKEYFFDVLYEDGVECVPGLVVPVTSADVDVTNQLMIVKLVEDIDDLSFKITCRIFDHNIFSDTPQSTFASAPPSGPSPFGPLPAPTSPVLSFGFDNGIPYIIITFTAYNGVNAGGTRITKQVAGGTIVDEGVFLSSPVKLVTPDSLGAVVTINLYSVDKNTGQSGTLFSTANVTPIFKSTNTYQFFTQVTGIFISKDDTKVNDGDTTIPCLVMGTNSTAYLEFNVSAPGFAPNEFQLWGSGINFDPARTKFGIESHPVIGGAWTDVTDSYIVHITGNITSSLQIFSITLRKNIFPSLAKWRVRITTLNGSTLNINECWPRSFAAGSNSQAILNSFNGETYQISSGILTDAAVLASNQQVIDGDALSLQKSSNLSDLNNNVTARANLGLGTLATQNGTFSGVSSGTNTGDQTITLTGDITGSGVAAFVATISNSVVTLAKMANMATNSLIYRKTVGSGAPEVNTLATLKTDLGLIGTNSGDQITPSNTPAVASNFFTAYNSATGVFTKAQPATSDISGLGTIAVQNFTAPTDVAYASGNFTTNVGTWTVDSGDQISYWYIQIGALMLVGFNFFLTSIASSPVELYFPIPASFNATKRSDAILGVCIENGTAVQTGSVKVDPSSSATRLAIFKPSGVAWANGVNNCYFGGQLWIR